ncbi:MAG: copper resistance protein NlpE [Muribaculaceae bacterium]|nr:copper resistance protein NlpE [Muribaculaceae bacterium]
MKKTFMVAALAALAVTGLASCNCNKNSCKNEKKGDRIEIYTGVLPAADADGVRYTLKLDFDDDQNYTDGDYDLNETFLVSDSTAVMGTRDTKSFLSEGDFIVENKDGKKYLKLVRDNKDSQVGSAEGPIYLLAENDSTLVMVNADLQLPENVAQYTLKRTK